MRARCGWGSFEARRKRAGWESVSAGTEPTDFMAGRARGYWAVRLGRRRGGLSRRGRGRADIVPRQSGLPVVSRRWSFGTCSFRVARRGATPDLREAIGLWVRGILRRLERKGKEKIRGFGREVQGLR